MLIDALLDYAWPGNIRELENMMKRFVVLQDEALVLAELAHAKEMAHVVAAPPPPAPVAARGASHDGHGSLPSMSDVPLEADGVSRDGRRIRR